MADFKPNEDMVSKKLDQVTLQSSLTLDFTLNLLHIFTFDRIMNLMMVMVLMITKRQK